MKIKVSEAVGPTLDWLVAKCEGRDIRPGRWRGKFSSNGGIWKPSENWSQGGPIIEREKIDLNHYRLQDLTAQWDASIDSWDSDWAGPTPLIAAMRCYVASKLGDEVEVPDELGEQP